MKGVPPVEWARKLLDEQLEMLSELRNANPRDAGFKQWRQQTLTVIQRIWPGDLARGERFRRIPFSPSGTRPTRGQIRDHFERGCAEASAYLKILTLELETQGLAKAAAGAEPKPAPLPGDLAGTKPSASKPPFDPRDLLEPSPLESVESKQPEPAEAPEAPAPSAAVETPAAPPAPAPPPRASAPAPANASPSVPAPTRTPRRVGRQQLKEMLGFADETKTPPPPPPPSPPSVAPPPPLPAFAAREEENEADLEDILAEAEEEALGPMAKPVDPEPSPSPGDLAIEFLSRPPRSAAPAPRPGAPAPRMPAPSAPARAADPQPTQVSISAVAAAPPKPVAPPEPSKPVAPPEPPKPAAPPPASPAAEVESSPSAVALTAIAGQVDRLGVPEGQRAAARAALIDFARQLDEEIASFDSIRELLWAVVDYPPLARRVIPILVPFLDLE